MNRSIINKQVLIVATIVTLILTSSSIIGTIASHPTDAHRNIAKQMDSVANQFSRQLSSRSDEEIREITEKNQKLTSTPEGRYIANAQTIAGIVHFGISFIAVVVLYRYLRGKRIVKEPVAITVSSLTVASLISIMADSLFRNAYLGTTFQPLLFGLSILGGSVASFAFAYIIARYLHVRRVKNNSFEIE